MSIQPKDRPEGKTVYFVRHGQSVDNASPVFQSAHTSLSGQGRQQALTVAKRLSSLSFDVLLASPLPRARETAEAIAAATHKQIDFSDLFVERIKPRTIDGKPYADEAARAAFNRWEAGLHGDGPKEQEGETFADIVARADAALHFLQQRPERTLVVVTHGYFLRTMIARVLVGDNLTGPLLQRFQTRALTKNTGITVLRREEAYEEDYAWRLLTYNDIAHFAE